ncbi:M23 family metallopeptidase [Sandaracinus amylolyticus]|uniref:Peptidase M23B n=1 Tax=Sandaracinus amylolyticus TaxID=927083 RepID=A0A0F6W4Y0_9BACT|nr:M23 family metallopeptidase [Sandaracinus amylolyticus]AKF07593.1 peptidase M23B [Sandaracinus amylolyticus]
MRVAIAVLALSLAIALPARAQIEVASTALAGTLVRARVEPGSTVRIDGRAVRVSARGEVLLGAAVDRMRPLRIDVRGVDGRRALRAVSIAARRDPIERLTGVRRELVVLRGALRSAQDAIDARLRVLRARDGAVAHFASGFVMPAEGRVTSPFAVHRVLDGGARDRHWGVDLAAAEGAAVRAPAAGVVVLDASAPLYGRILVIDHGHGLTSSLLHLARVDVEIGAVVRRGDVIARVGRTGRVTGAHLDWRLHLLGVALDPRSAL